MINMNNPVNIIPSSQTFCTFTKEDLTSIASLSIIFYFFQITFFVFSSTTFSLSLNSSAKIFLHFSSSVIPSFWHACHLSLVSIILCPFTIFLGIVRLSISRPKGWNREVGSWVILMRQLWAGIYPLRPYCYCLRILLLNRNVYQKSWIFTLRPTQSLQNHSQNIVIHS